MTKNEKMSATRNGNGDDDDAHGGGFCSDFDCGFGCGHDGVMNDGYDVYDFCSCFGFC